MITSCAVYSQYKIIIKTLQVKACYSLSIKISSFSQFWQQMTFNMRPSHKTINFFLLMVFFDDKYAIIL